MVVAACVLAAWLTGPAQANGPLPGVSSSTPVATVQQVAAPVVATVQPSAVRSAASPGRPAARVSATRAAAAEPAAPAVQPAPRPALQTAATTVATAPQRAESRVRGAVAKARSSRVAAAARTRTERAVAAASDRLVVAARLALRRLATAADASSSPLAPAAAGVASSYPRGTGSGPHAGAARLGAPANGLGLLPATAAADAPRSSALAVRPDPVAAGWRNASVEATGRKATDLAGFAVPTSRPGGPLSAAAAPAGAAGTALLGLLGFLVFASRHHGTLVRLRPAWAPAAPFLALLERPG